MTVSESLPTSCPCSGAIGFAGRFFAARDSSRGRLSGSAHTRPPSSFRIVGDANFLSRSRDALELRWSHHAYLLPASFRGSLTVVPAFDGSELTLTGISAPASVASLRAAMRSLLQQIAAHLDREWRNFEANCTSVATCNARTVRPAMAATVAVSRSAVPA